MGNVCFECKSCGFILFWGRFKCIFQEFMYVCVICSYPKKKKKKCVICYMLWVAQVFVSIVPLKWVRV